MIDFHICRRRNWCPATRRDQRYWTRKRVIDQRRRDRKRHALFERIMAECFTVMAEKSPIIAAMQHIVGPALRYFPYE